MKGLNNVSVTNKHQAEEQIFQEVERWKEITINSFVVFGFI